VAAFSIISIDRSSSMAAAVLALVGGEWQAGLVPWPNDQTIDALRDTVVDVFKMACPAKALCVGLFRFNKDDKTLEDNRLVFFLDLLPRDRVWYDAHRDGATLGFYKLDVKAAAAPQPSTPPRPPASKRMRIESPEESPLTSPAQSIYDILTEAGKPWCRVCGTYFSTTWRNSPVWGSRTLCVPCSKIDAILIKAYAANHPSHYPYTQNFCHKCKKEGDENDLLFCDGCERALHKGCMTFPNNVVAVNENVGWFCSDDCSFALQRVRARATIATLTSTESPSS
jgi:hypothetical protein